MPTPRKPIDCSYCNAKDNCLLNMVAERLDNPGRIRDRRSAVRLGKRELLHRHLDAAESVAVVCHGRVKTYRMTEDGKSLITRIAEPGSTIGLGAVFAGARHADYAEAIEGTVVGKLDRDTLLTVIREEPAAAAVFLQDMASALDQAERQSLQVAYSPAAERLHRTLWELQEENVAAGEDAEVTMRRQDLAGLVGLTVETTVRALKTFERQGIVALHGRAIRLLQAPEGVPAMMAA